MAHSRARTLIPLGLVLGLATLVASVISATAAAAPGTTVAFLVQNPFLTGGTQTILASSIPGCPTGTVTDANVTASFNGPVRMFSGTKLFDCGPSGMFTLAFDVHGFVGGSSDSGTWKIVGGTGTYAGMTGQGQLAGTYYSGGTYDNYTGTLRLAGS